MSQKVWNGPFDQVVIANGGTASDAFSMPDSALGVTFIFPTLSNAVKLQTLTPKFGDQDADAWTDLSTILTGAAAVTISTVSAFASGTAVGMDAGVLGGGVFRFVSGGAEAAARTINIVWRTDRKGH